MNIRETEEYRLVKQLTSKENRKALKKATIDVGLFFAMVYAGYFLALYGMLFIWNN